jgi:glycine cleavage system pyridoxal-binding protein P
LSRYTSVTGDDRERMLAKIGVSSIQDLFADVP